MTLLRNDAAFGLSDRGLPLTIKIKVWNGSERFSGFTTGVGKHVVHMVSGLAGKPEVHVEFIVPRDAWGRDQALKVDAPLAGIPSQRYGLSRRMAEFLWVNCDHPRLDEIDTDWIYAPRERYIPAGRAKSIVTIHDVYGFEPQFAGSDGPAPPPLALGMLRKALSRADIVAVVSDFTANRLEKLFAVRPDKMVVVGNGVEEHFFSVPTVAVSDFAPQLAGGYILSVGGLTHKKGATYQLALARALETAAPGIVFAITGPVAEVYRGEAGALRNVSLLGRGYTNEQMHALAAGSAATIVLSEYEGFGIPVLEAMAVGSPVVAARRAALPEIVGDAGLIVDPCKGSAVRDAVMSAIMDSTCRADLIARGRRRADAFRWHRCVDRLYNAMTGSFSARASWTSGGNP